MLDLTDENFDETILKSQKPVLIDFWATWCHPCSVLSLTLEKIEEEYKDKILFAKVNIDIAPLTSQKFEIELIPTVILFKNGKSNSDPSLTLRMTKVLRMTEKKFVGVKSEEEIREWLDVVNF